MKLTLESYLIQKEKLPKTGRHIVAQFNTEAVVVSLRLPSHYWLFCSLSRLFWRGI